MSVVRNEVMLEVINSIPTPLSKTALVKLLYFLQEYYQEGLGYEFTFYTHGPFTHEILRDLEGLDKDGMVKIANCNFGGYPGFAISATAEGKEIDEEIKEKVRSLVERFGSLNARQLELRATLHYIRHNGGLEGVELFKTVNEMKPKYDMKEIEEASEKIADLL